MGKFLTILITLLITPTAYLLAQQSPSFVSKTTLRSFLVKLETPPGWSLKSIDGADGYICSSPDNNSTIIIMADAANSLEYYKSMLPNGIDLGQGVSIRSLTQMIKVSLNKAYSAIDVAGPNGSVAGTVGVMQKAFGGVIGLLAVTQKPSQEADLKKMLLNMLSSCVELNSAEIAEIKKDDEKAGSQVLRVWYTNLNNSRLQKYSSYSSGYGRGGMYSSIYYDLCTGGYYRMYSQFNSSIGSPSEKTERGTWVLTHDQGNIYLVLSSSTGSTSRFSISSDSNTSIYLNKVKYLIGRSGDVGPRCN